VIGFTVANGKIFGIDQLADPERIERLNLSAIAVRNRRVTRLCDELGAPTSS
jgi:hypothetical protein